MIPSVQKKKRRIFFTMNDALRKRQVLSNRPPCLLTEKERGTPHFKSKDREAASTLVKNVVDVQPSKGRG